MQVFSCYQAGHETASSQACHREFLPSIGAVGVCSEVNLGKWVESKPGHDCTGSHVGMERSWSVLSIGSYVGDLVDHNYFLIVYLLLEPLETIHTVGYKCGLACQGLGAGRGLSLSRSDWSLPKIICTGLDNPSYAFTHSCCGTENMRLSGTCI